MKLTLEKFQQFRELNRIKHSKETEKWKTLPRWRGYAISESGRIAHKKNGAFVRRVGDKVKLRQGSRVEWIKISDLMKVWN